MTAMGLIAYCIAGDNQLAIAGCDCLGDNSEDCIEPYACGWMSDVEEPEMRRHH
jgi:hypothetical protein